MMGVVPLDLCVLHKRARKECRCQLWRGRGQTIRLASQDGPNLLRAPMPVTTTFLFGIVDMRSEVLDEPVRLLEAVRGAPTPENPIASGSAAMAITAAAVHTRTYIWQRDWFVREWCRREVRVGRTEVRPCVRRDAEEVEATDHGSGTLLDEFLLYRGHATRVHDPRTLGRGKRGSCFIHSRVTGGGSITHAQSIAELANSVSDRPSRGRSSHEIHESSREDSPPRASVSEPRLGGVLRAHARKFRG
jgi:hypothetical protein